MFNKTTARQISQYIKEIEDFYYIDEQGKVYSERGKRLLRLSIEKRYSLLNKDNKYKSISLKKLYKNVFNKEFCIDNIKNLDGEQWKEIPQTNGLYYASNKGRIKSYVKYQAIILEPFPNSTGYLRVTLKIDGKRKDIFVHKIIADLFIQDKPTIQNTIKYELHHIDHNRYNNNVNNLIYLTQEEHKKIHIEYNRKQKQLEKELEQKEI